MRKPKVNKLQGRPSDKVSGRVLAVLIAFSALLFAAFYLVGYDMPYIGNFNFNAPLLTDALLIYIYILGALAVTVAIVSMVHGLKSHSSSIYGTNGVPARKIAFGTAGLLVGSMAVTFAFGSSAPLRINGMTFAETGWLKLTDMFIGTSVILGLVAVAAVAYGMSGYNRRINGNAKKH